MRRVKRIEFLCFRNTEHFGRLADFTNRRPLSDFPMVSRDDASAQFPGVLREHRNERKDASWTFSPRPQASHRSPVVAETLVVDKASASVRTMAALAGRSTSPSLTIHPSPSRRSENSLSAARIQCIHNVKVRRKQAAVTKASGDPRFCNVSVADDKPIIW
jgi:hypothetical protein